jgi:hypothetical protein
MALTLGTNAYIELATFKAWALERNIELYDYLDSEIEAAIVASSDYLDAYYKFKGDAVDADQAMQLPTGDVAIADIAKPACEAAWLQLRSLLSVDSSTLDTKGVIESESKSLDGVGSKSTTYAKGTAQNYKRNTPLLDRMLSKFTGGGVRLERA